MSRSIGAANISHVSGQNVHEVILVKLEFSTPVYAHSGIGNISYDGNTYLGVGDFGSANEVRESAQLGPSPIELRLSGIDSALLAESMSAANYGDLVTIYSGYRLDDGTLVGDPWIVTRGKIEFPSSSRGEDNTIILRVQHDLAVLDEIPGAKFSDEDQVTRYPADRGFEFVEEQGSLRLPWASTSVQATGSTEYADRRSPGYD